MQQVASELQALSDTLIQQDEEVMCISRQYSIHPSRDVLCDDVTAVEGARTESATEGSTRDRRSSPS